MKTLLHILFSIAITGTTLGQTKGVLKKASDDTITESLNIGAGKTVTIKSGATLAAEEGAIVIGLGGGGGVTPQVLHVTSEGNDTTGNGTAITVNEETPERQAERP